MENNSVIQESKDKQEATLPKKPYKIFTLIYVMQENKMLLGLKKRGFAKGKWNGFGGKVEKNETIFAAMERELKEESGITAVDPIFQGLLVYDIDIQDTIFQVHVFRANNFTGTIIETDEMLPQWFDIKDLPYDKMWIDDQIFFPLLFQNKYFYGYFDFQGYETITNYELLELTDQQLNKKQKSMVSISLI